MRATGAGRLSGLQMRYGELQLYRQSETEEQECVFTHLKINAQGRDGSDKFAQVPKFFAGIPYVPHRRFVTHLGAAVALVLASLARWYVPIAIPKAKGCGTSLAQRAPQVRA